MAAAGQAWPSRSATSSSPPSGAAKGPVAQVQGALPFQGPEQLELDVMSVIVDGTNLVPNAGLLSAAELAGGCSWPGTARTAVRGTSAIAPWPNTPAHGLQRQQGGTLPHMPTKSISKPTASSPMHRRPNYPPWLQSLRSVTNPLARALASVPPGHKKSGQVPVAERAPRP